MELPVEFRGGVRVAARVRGHVVETDQPVDAGGDGTAASPFDLFLASIATCAGFYAVRFCQERGIASDGLGVTMHTETGDASGKGKRIVRMAIEVTLPPGFPEKYRAAIVRAIDQCAVKKHILEPPEITVEVVSPAAA